MNIYLETQVDYFYRQSQARMLEIQIYTIKTNEYPMIFKGTRTLTKITIIKMRIEVCINCEARLR